jgi:hypothetical protein
VTKDGIFEEIVEFTDCWIKYIKWKPKILSPDETPSIKNELLIVRLIAYLNNFTSINPEEITYIFDIQPSVSHDTLVFIYNIINDRYTYTKLMIVQMDEEIEAEMENFKETFKTLTAVLFQENDINEAEYI